MLENKSLNKSIKTKGLSEGKRKIQTEILIKSIRQQSIIKKRKENQLQRKAKKTSKVVLVGDHALIIR